jgi:hypothetical protein
MGRFIKNYSLSLVLAALFLLSWLFHGFTGWKAHLAEQKEHAAAAVLWGDDGFIWRFLERTFENWQPEFLAAALHGGADGMAHSQGQCRVTGFE